MKMGRAVAAKTRNLLARVSGGQPKTTNHAAPAGDSGIIYPSNHASMEEKFIASSGAPEKSALAPPGPPPAPPSPEQTVVTQKAQAAEAIPLESAWKPATIEVAGEDWNIAGSTPPASPMYPRLGMAESSMMGPGMMRMDPAEPSPLMQSAMKLAGTMLHVNDDNLSDHDRAKKAHDLVSMTGHFESIVATAADNWSGRIPHYYSY